MLIMLRLLFITVITIVADVCAQSSDKEHQGPQTCGGQLTGPVGTIQTPNFPNAFSVPIKCKWIIQNELVNGTISIYFTQQYTTSGLTFTEYTYYDDSYKLGERRALTVTEENITRIKWLQVQSPVLVVELNLNRLEGTQLRALRLLSVFGFNITYAVRGPTDSPSPTSCSAIECRLLGHCYAKADYQEFFCSCFEDYSGVDCGVGPLCQRTSNMCRNGGTCRQMGPAAVSCICAPGYTGDLCEAQLAQPECGIEECSEGCKQGTSCDCNPKDDDFTSARFDTRLQVVDQPNNDISQEVVKELTSYLLASNITLNDEIEILNISGAEGGARTVYVRVWSARGGAGALRSALARLAVSRARPTRLRLLPDTTHFIMHPALSLHTLAVNQKPEVWEGSEFILTCMAYGSPDITFTWYKDGVKINFNGTTREIWTRSVSEDALGRRMSVLGVSAARQADSGAWSCAADDAHRRRCRALTLTVLTAPSVRLVPSTLTVSKGDNVSVTCLAGAGRAHGMLGFSWARERSLLPMQPDKHVWEDLYPAGSVLRLYNVQKSSEYRCQVSSAAGTNSAGVTVWALGADDEACQSEMLYGTRWNRTAPGAYASDTCPPRYSGETTRFCESKTGQHGVKWKMPDFSGCVADSLKYIYEQFTLISYGYSWSNVSEVSRQYLSVLRSLPAWRGAGVSPLRHSAHMLQYALSAAAQRTDRHHSVLHLLNIYDYLLTQPDAFLDEEKIYELQNLIVDTAGMRHKLSVHLHSFSVMSESGVHSEMRHSLSVPSASEWRVTSAHVELAPAASNLTMITVIYRELAARLPSLKAFIEYKAGDEVQYTVCSQQVQVSVSGAPYDVNLQHTVTVLFEHFTNYSTDASRLACGLRSVSAPSTWSVSACDVRVTHMSRATCRCHSLGTITLLVRTSQISTETTAELRGVAVVSASVCGAMCLCACALQLLRLAPVTRSRDTLGALLRAATGATHAAAMFALLHCDNARAACAGTVGWLLAACATVASAALAAQPLLLHAELAASGRRTHCVGLLAGVCVLCCLSARLWGGAPLQVGSAASNIFTGGIVLLTVLALVLALCARKILRHVTHKLPPDRRAYVKHIGGVVHNTLILLVTSSATLVSTVVYVQPGDKQVAHVAALSVAALANGVAMLVCYVIRDEECLQALRSILTFSNHSTDWHDSPAGDTSLNLYIRQAGEVESRGGVVPRQSRSAATSPAATYYTRDRRQSTPDSRADIVRCVEYRAGACGGVCDLVPPSAPHDYVATVCRRRDQLPVQPVFQPYSDHSQDTDKETCTICAQSNPDVSKISSPPMKSCLKKKPRGFTSSTSLPSIDSIRDCDKSHIEHINREWNKAYDNPQTDKVLNKISTDLDFLLNRTQDSSTNTPHIEEAPT